MANQTPFISKMVHWLGIRRHRMWLRYRDDLSTRSIPKPVMPPTENSAISSNYYYSRDSRREVEPPMIVHQSGVQKRIEGGEETEKAPAQHFPTPGIPAQWTLSKENGL